MEGKNEDMRGSPEDAISNVVKYEWLGKRDSELKNAWFEVGKKRVKGEWIMLDEVKIEYGKNELLGECVNDFIEAVGAYCVEHNFESVCCYAHNGCGFDAFVLEAFNTKYHVYKRLKTGRGLLSLTLDYPYIDRSDGGGEKEKKLKIKFLDTKVFLAFSLAKICQDFKVPSEWSKLDFPITRLRWYNCYHPEIKLLTEPYAINDVMSLAFIVKQINRMITFQKNEVVEPGMEEFLIIEEEGNRNLTIQAMNEAKQKLRTIVPYNLKSTKPPILQFLTFMSVVKKMLDTYFSRFGLRKAMSVDVSGMRYWIERCQMGGRTSPYAKAYASGRWKEIMMAHNRGDKEETKRICNEAIEDGDCAIVLDSTSLYPYVMGCCPMPNGVVRVMELGEEKYLIEIIGCEECEKLMTLCETHIVTNEKSQDVRNPCLRPFAVILVKGLRPSPEMKMNLRHQCGRKMKKSVGLQYTLETNEELFARIGTRPCEIEAYTNVDLYWMLKQGFIVEEYVGGFVWETTGDYRDFIFGGFEMRKDAKKAKNQSLQLTLKLLLNGTFGVHSQKIIRTKDLVTTLPEGLYQQHYSDTRIRTFVAKNHLKVMDVRHEITNAVSLATGQTVITGTVPKDTGEALGGGYSPNHVGAAVLAWSRHAMNLVMFAIEGEDCFYTDTDSVCVPYPIYQKMVLLGNDLIDETGQKLGSYKNDHGDYFKDHKVTNPAVFFSAIGAKKVKMHIIFDREGEVQIANTYKGFLSMGCCPESGKKYPSEKLLWEQSQALLEILYHGVPEDRYGTRWTRGGGTGVSIEKKVLMSCDTKTYLHHCKGFTIDTAAAAATTKGFRSYIVPYGCERNDLKMYSGIPIIDPSTGKVLKYEMENGWEKALEEGMGGGGVNFQTMSEFISKYYDRKYQNSLKQISNENKVKYAEINKIFDSMAIIE